MITKGPIRFERLIAIILLVGFLLYGLFEAYKLILGPRIEILSPVNGSTIESATVIIEGKTRNISFISLNDRQIFIDDQNIFREKLLLPPGYTIIKIAALDRFKQRIEKKISLWRPYDNVSQKSIIEELKNTSTSSLDFTASTTATTTTITE